MICTPCSKVGIELEKSFTKTERMFALASAVAMLRSMESGRNDTNDKTVANSVITKLLLSFHENSRGILLEHFRKSLGLEITLGNCAHGLMVIQ